jgi:hypothetical protein
MRHPTSVTSSRTGGFAVTEPTFDRPLLGFSPSAADPLGRLEEAAFWLETYCQALHSQPLRVFELVDRVDEQVHRDRLSLTHEYLAAAGRMQRFREQRIWTAAVRFARMLAGGYESCLGLFQAGAGGSEALRPLLPVVAARIVRAHMLDLRWTLMRYSAVEPRIWSRMGAVYAFCERIGLERATFNLYPGMAQQSSVRREYLRALLLSVSGMETLLPEGQVIAERAIAYVAEFFLLHRKPARSCHFAVDLEASRPPYRMGEGLQSAKSWRFFGPGDASVLIDGMAERAGQAQATPPELRLIGTFPVPLVVEVLRHLSRFWGPTPPERAEVRQRVLSTFNVAHGFEDVFAAVSGSAPERDLDELTEVWTVENESEGGFGASLPGRIDDWLSVGTLVAAKPTWPAAWSVGVVRRLSTDSAGRRRVGVQLLARGGTAVQLVPVGAAAVPGPNVQGVLLPSSRQSSLASGEITIVVPRDVVSHSQAYEMRFEGHAYTVVPRSVVEQGPEFTVLRFGIRGRAA